MRPRLHEEETFELSIDDEKVSDLNDPIQIMLRRDEERVQRAYEDMRNRQLNQAARHLCQVLGIKPPKDYSKSPNRKRLSLVKQEYLGVTHKK